MTQRRRWILISLLLTGIFFCIGFLAGFQLPNVRSWILVKINDISEKHLPVRILPKNVRLHLFPLGATFETVRILPKPEIAMHIDPFVIDQVSVELSALQLAQGRLRLRNVNIRKAAATVRVPKQPKSDRPPLEGLFQQLGLSPIARLELEDIDLKLTVADPQLRAEIRDIDASAEIVGKSLALTLSAASTSVKDPETQAQVRLQVEAGAYLERDAITISEFKLRRGASYVIGSGVLKGDTEALKFNDAQLETRLSLHLESMRNWLVKSVPKLASIPPLRGQLNAEAKVLDLVAARPRVEFRLETQDLYESRFFIDRIEAKGIFENGVVTIPLLTMKNPGTDTALHGLEIHVPRARREGQDSSAQARVGPPAPYRIKFDGEVQRFDLHAFLKTLGLSANVPVWLEFEGKTPCEGTLAPTFRLACKGEMHARDLFVNEKKEIPGAIVALPRFDASGDFVVDAHQVSYKSEIRMPKSAGRSQGVIDYAQGFKISYEADTLDFADKSALANLRLEGSAKLKGVTEGDSHRAWMKMDLEGKDLWFEDYWLGTAKTEIGYKDGVLSFDRLNGHYTTSRYMADIDVNVREKTIKTTAKIPFFEAKDLLTVFSRRVKLPFPVTGTGKAEVKVSGPLQFNYLTYDLKTTLYRGTIWRENFDQAHFDVRARDGHVVADRVMIAKEDSTITLQGTGHPDGNINTVIRGRALRLEDSINVAALGFNLSGLVDFDMDVTGYVLRPSTDLRGTIVKSAIGDQGVPDSHFRLKFREKTIEGGGAFLGDMLESDFIIPLTPQSPFRLDLKTREWNFAPLFGAIAGPGAKKDYDGRLTAHIALASATGGFWNSSGKISVPNFRLRRSSLQMTAPQPIQMVMRDGHLEVQSFFLEGDGTFLRVVDSPNPVAKLDVQVNGKVDLSLMALMMPFFEEIRGLLSFAFNFRAGPGTADILGSVYIDKGFLKLFGFPHSFEEIKGDFLFNQKKVLINSLKADLAGGRVTAD
ncbi:MAG: AsmA-like C-terminal region-containing protein, partial [Bdellovibrionaceae bacterium]|nr:AsmA-like C-terminal region-containing protein [Pseudobdellovibrionaceae bacterium]